MVPLSRLVRLPFIKKRLPRGFAAHFKLHDHTLSPLFFKPALTPPPRSFGGVGGHHSCSYTFNTHYSMTPPNPTLGVSALQRVEVLMVDAYIITKDLRKPCSDDNMVSANWVSISSKNPKSKTFQNRTSGPQWALANSLQIQPCFGLTFRIEKTLKTLAVFAQARDSRSIK